MNAPDKIPFADQFALSREPFPASRKIYVPGSNESIRVPMREILLSNGEQVTVYDTSGPYSDPAAAIDVRTGLADVRGAWIAARGDTENYTGRQRAALDDGAALIETDDVKQVLAEIDAIDCRRPRCIPMHGWSPFFLSHSQPAPEGGAGHPINGDARREARCGGPCLPGAWGAAGVATAGGGLAASGCLRQQQPAGAEGAGTARRGDSPVAGSCLPGRSGGGAPAEGAAGSPHTAQSLLPHLPEPRAPACPRAGAGGLSQRPVAPRCGLIAGSVCHRRFMLPERARPRTAAWPARAHAPAAHWRGDGTPGRHPRAASCGNPWR